MRARPFWSVPEDLADGMPEPGHDHESLSEDGIRIQNLRVPSFPEELDRIEGNPVRLLNLAEMSAGRSIHPTARPALVSKGRRQGQAGLHRPRRPGPAGPEGNSAPPLTDASWSPCTSR